jgi:hypothetical protein
MQEDSGEQRSRFEAEAAGRRRGFVREFLAFLGHTKKWWLLPIVLLMVLLGLLVLLQHSPLAPFFYPLF